MSRGSSPPTHTKPSWYPEQPKKTSLNLPTSPSKQIFPTPNPSNPFSMKSIKRSVSQTLSYTMVCLQPYTCLNALNNPPALAAAAKLGVEPFSIPLEDFISTVNVNTVSTYAAIQEAIAGFQTLPESALKTFIFTGNALNRVVFPSLIPFGAAKTAVAHMIEGASGLYAKEGFRYVIFPDELM
ncbi:hypothetical protein ACMFMF_000160 [Clarireedia jacksonii]